uniref:Uncharacterized protein n=1 Tax=Populus trichocarpa TaxID=3694 RepID=B9GK52_POPTR
MVGIKVHQRWDHGQIDIVYINDLSMSVFNPNAVGEEVAEEFTVDAVAGERDVDPNEKLEVVFAWYLRIVKEDEQEEDELEKLNGVESCRQQDPITLGPASYEHRLIALWTTL